MFDLVMGIATVLTVIVIIAFAGLNLLYDKKN